ncbi:MAG: CheR family methyltransferase [Bacteroidota bacterium]
MLNQLTKKEVSKAISTQIGINIDIDKWSDFEHKFKSACKELKIDNEESFFDLILNSIATKEQIETLATHLTIGETYFFRETEAIDVFKNTLLPKLIEQRRGINQTIDIWSAGCCTGEEPYSIAMILSEAIPDIKSWNINILATDINQHYLRKAKRGVYTQWSFRTTHESTIDKYFIRNALDYKITDKIKSMIHFRKLNLVDEFEFPSDTIRENSIDVLFCRNVLMYFPPEQILNVANRFYKCLVEGGWLITSPVEVSSEGFIKYNSIYIDGTTILEKNSLANNSINNTLQYISQLSKKVVDKIDAFNHTNVLQSKIHQSQQQHKTTANTTNKTAHKTKDSESSLLLKEAQKYFKRNNYQEAIIVLNEILKLEPNNITAQTLLVQSLANSGNLIEAGKKCEKYLETNNQNAALHYLLATILLELNETTTAEQALRKAIYIDHSLVMAQFEMANLLHKQGNKKASEKHYQNVLNLINSLKDEEVLPYTDGMTSSRMKEIINNFLN